MNKLRFYNISQGCEFIILTDKNINTNKQSINISTNFIEESNSSIIDANCNLIPNNDNIIKCKTNQEINNYYTPNEFIYYDEDELFILLNENKDVSYNLSCKNESLGTNIPEPSTQNNRGYLSKTSGSNSTGMIVGIIAGVIALIAALKYGDVNTEATSPGEVKGLILKNN